MSTSTRLRTRASAPSRGRRLALRSLVVLAVVLLLCALALVLFRVARAGVLPGVALDGIDLGGQSEEIAQRSVAGYADERALVPLTVVHGEDTVESTAGDAGYAVLVEPTHERVMERGRQLNPVLALADHVRASFGRPTDIEPVEQVEADRNRTWAEEMAATLELAPVEGTVEFEDGQAVRIDPADGADVRVGPLADDGRAAALAGEPAEIEVQTDPVAPVTTTADVDAVMPLAERAMSGPVTLSRNDGSLTLGPEEIGTVLSVALDADADPKLTIVADADRFAELVPDSTIAGFNVDPVNAQITLSGGAIRISESRNGFRFDPEVAAEQLLEVATGDGERNVRLEGETVAPDRSTEDAQNLGIREQVSTFTTNFTAGQSRVRNIQRFADLVHGQVIEPGDTFSLNGHVGERTTAKGFVPGGAIFDGEFIEDIGGGVSQFATTFYNAAYFGGYEFLAYKAHSYYISRYPMGREATIDYPSVDLKIRNNSPHGLLIATSHTSTSVTVSFWATKWVDVESRTGQPTNYRQPETRYRSNPDLPAGSERVVQSGRQGFDVTDVRVLRFPDGRVEEERFFTRYLAEPRIVERGT
jgi:vancomycin resistance protein YoaR